MKKFTAVALTSVTMMSLLAVPVLALDTGINYGTALGLGTKDVREGTMSIVNSLLGFLGIIAVLLILYGGFKWMTAGGNDEKIGEAKKWIFAGVIGLAIILSAYALTSFVITQLVSATGE